MVSLLYPQAFPPVRFPLFVVCRECESLWLKSSHSPFMYSEPTHFGETASPNHLHLENTQIRDRKSTQPTLKAAYSLDNEIAPTLFPGSQFPQQRGLYPKFPER